MYFQFRFKAGKTITISEFSGSSFHSFGPADPEAVSHNCWLMEGPLADGVSLISEISSRCIAG